MEKLSFGSSQNLYDIMGGAVSHNCIREMIKSGKMPGFYCGRNFRININMAIDMFNEVSKRNAEVGANQ